MFWYEVITEEKIVEEIESIMDARVERSSPSWVCIPQKSLAIARDFWNTNSRGWTPLRTATMMYHLYFYLQKRTMRPHLCLWWWCTRDGRNNIYMYNIIKYVRSFVVLRFCDYIIVPSWLNGRIVLVAVKSAWEIMLDRPNCNKVQQSKTLVCTVHVYPDAIYVTYICHSKHIISTTRYPNHFTWRTYKRASTRNTIRVKSHGKHALTTLILSHDYWNLPSNL